MSLGNSYGFWQIGTTKAVRVTGGGARPGTIVHSLSLHDGSKYYHYYSHSYNSSYYYLQLREQQLLLLY